MESTPLESNYLVVCYGQLLQVCSSTDSAIIHFVTVKCSTVYRGYGLAV